MSCWGMFIRRQYQFSSLLKLHQLNIQPMCHQRGKCCLKCCSCTFQGFTDVFFLLGFRKTTAVKTYDVRKVELTPLEQRKLTFDSHALVKELESSGMFTRFLGY